jgi:guanylate kinase
MKPDMGAAAPAHDRSQRAPLEAECQSTRQIRDRLPQASALRYSPPDWERMVDYLRLRALPGVESAAVGT